MDDFPHPSRWDEREYRVEGGGAKREMKSAESDRFFDSCITLTASRSAGGVGGAGVDGHGRRR